MCEVFKSISLSKETNHVFFIDKNHPESAIKPCVKNIDEKSALFANLKVKKVALLPAYKQRLQEKGHYSYPFSSAYVLSCLRRVILRPEHLTLEGSEEEKSNIVLSFTNLFRNFSGSNYNLRKFFDGKVRFTLNNEDCLDPEQHRDIFQLFKELLLAGKPGKFGDPHPRMQQLAAMLKQV
jgi:hypothetical protein